MPELRSHHGREVSLGCWVSLRDPAVAEICGHLPFDHIVLDIEHTPHSLESIEHMIRAIEAADADTDVIVRVPRDDIGIVNRVLDLGPTGIMAPMITTAEDAERFVRATRYPPDGNRGIAAGRSAKYGIRFDEYMDRANDDLVTIAQIETESSLQQIDDIVDLEWLDGVFIGPSDLSARLGSFGNFEGETYNDAVEAILASVTATETFVSTLVTSKEDISRRVSQGFDHLVIGVDKTFLINGANDYLRAYDEANKADDGS